MIESIIMSKTRAHVFIAGLVQGVFFRAYTRENAITFNLTGWVKNHWDGRVEAVFEGEKEDIDKIIKWCYKGPPAARVDNVEVTWGEHKGEYDSFSLEF